MGNHILSCKVLKGALSENYLEMMLLEWTLGPCGSIVA